ncbi:MAG: cell division FtsA domain-containing protein [Candidatus Pelagibacter sp.]
MLETFIDFGTYKTRLGVFNKNSSSKDYFIEKKTESNVSIEDINLHDFEKRIKELVQTAEKKINHHIKDLNVMLDLSSFSSIDVSLKKNYEGKNITLEDIQILLQESRQMFQESNRNNKIIHMIVKKFFFDKKVFFEIPENNLKCNNLTLEIKFICYPNNILENIQNIFNRNDILVNSFSCSTYVKSLNYNKLFPGYKKKFFLDIGFRKTCLAVYNHNILTHLNSIPVGGDHITSDISQVLKLSKEESEIIKKTLNNTDTVFSGNEVLDQDELENNFQLIHKDIPRDLLKKVIFARIEEIISLSFKKINFNDTINEKNYILVFIGEGSKILNKNAIYLGNNYHFINEMNFYDDNVESICRSAHNISNNNYNNEVNLVSKKPKKRGFFEKLFNLFN